MDFRIIFRGEARAVNSIGELVMATLDRELHDRIAALRPVQKRQVLEYVRGLEDAAPELKPAAALLRYAGSIPAEVVNEMERLIEED
jgi:hypothetical protein